ncbi:hypothetical protein FACS189418_8150 [Clostridia bacterium]|nr:hypothetical protein FACS189418_8150 [Clostridia bacterium]
MFKTKNRDEKLLFFITKICNGLNVKEQRALFLTKVVQYLTKAKKKYRIE